MQFPAGLRQKTANTGCLFKEIVQEIIAHSFCSLTSSSQGPDSEHECFFEFGCEFEEILMLTILKNRVGWVIFLKPQAVLIFPNLLDFTGKQHIQA